MLEIKNISSGYGKKQVLFDVSFDVNDNEIVWLTGGNGSGKSTVFKCIYGLLPKWNCDARVIFNGTDITNLPTFKMVNYGIGYIPQKNNYFDTLTIHDNLMVSGSRYSKTEVKLRLDEVYHLPLLYNFRKRTPFNLSGGERQLLALGNALMHKPRFILFDEPIAGLDESNAKIIMNALQLLKENGIPMLIIEHKKTFKSLANRELNLYLGKLT